ncbi:FMN-dependent NADH-azoreductase [Litoreibacter roseus]|uniref:FMN dependent NADH:quinone oxidoreductase n=1 Tax=Litoreibacter roseus TaxID=2601869 RepID=A0A6N6JGH3_9RHOB|nr:NAD(P)H-dependent oxidoreductase [Litoreibacter roseus]GFE65214.1 FMN-dependent NADH-azoreductase [Litoreibacter roseus]
MTILHIDASARSDGSVSRKLTASIVDQLGGEVIRRDLADGLPFVDEAWVGATFTPTDQRTQDQKHALALSDKLVAELQAADTLVIGAPIYNFGVPAVLKAWIDMIARLGVTFKYTSDGPVGLLEGKRAVIVIASGGTAAWSDIDFATPHLRQIMTFVGINDVEFVIADTLGAGADQKIAAAQTQIDALAA